MNTSRRLLPLLLSGILLFSACGKTAPAQTENHLASEFTTATSTVSDATVQTTAVSEVHTTSADTSEPTVLREEKTLPEPYIDIEFTADGRAADKYGHVSCTLPASENGRVINDAVTLDGKTYTVPHYYAERPQGAMVLTYEYLVTEADVTQLMKKGFTVETFLVNRNRLSTADTEQCMTNAGQSGGFGLSIKNGKLGFGVYTDTSYKTASFPGKYDTENLTHLLGVFDPDAKRVSLYANGMLVASSTAAGEFRPAQQNCHPYIVLGGDIGSGGKTELYATDTRITDFKLYPAALTADEAKIAYDTAIAALTSSEPAFDLIYHPVQDLPKGTADATYKNILSSFADVYEPITSLLVSPTVWQTAGEDFAALSHAEERPATVLFDLRMAENGLHVCDRNGRDLGLAEDAIKALGGQIIPAFRVTDAASVTPLTELINRHNIGDCFVICSDGGQMKEICDATVCARPVLDRSAVTRIDPSALFTEAAYFGTKRILLPAASLTQELVLAMHARGMTVFALLDTNDIASIHNAIFVGADGILTGDCSAVFDYYRSFTKTTISESSLIVAHRGDHAAYPDNTIRSLISGAESGANVIELDVWLTADGHLVLNHDAKTNGWSEVLDCMNATRAQLETLRCTSKYAVQGDKLAFYEEVMDYFSKNHTDIVLFVEMKDTRQAAGDKAVELTKAYGMQDRVIYLSSNLSFDQYMFNTHRVPVLKNSASVYPRTDLKRALALSCIDLGSLPTDYFTQWKDADVDLMRMLRHRGIAYGPWTTGTAADTDAHFFLGYANFTTNVPHQCDKYLRFLKVDEMDNRITVTAVYYDGTTADVTAHAEFVPLEGNVSYRNGEVSGQGAYTFRLRTALPIRTDLTYFVYSLSMCR